MTIAGHTFDSTDTCVTLVSSTVDGVLVTHVCGRHWTEIMHCDESCVGLKGYAHVDRLNSREVGEIVQERERRATLYEHATRSLSGGGGEGAPTPSPIVQEDTMLCYTPASRLLKIAAEQSTTVTELDNLGAFLGYQRNVQEPTETFRRRLIAVIKMQSAAELVFGFIPAGFRQ